MEDPIKQKFLDDITRPIARKLEVKHLSSDYNDAPTVDELIDHLGKQTGFSLEGEDEGDRTAADYADANPVQYE